MSASEIANQFFLALVLNWQSEVLVAINEVSVV